VTAVVPDAEEFVGGIFDGRYLYLVPFLSSGRLAMRTVVVRYDTLAAFEATASWSSFDLGTVDPRAQYFQGGAFDGRYVYFVPYGDPAGSPPAASGVAARYDTQAAFTDTSAWSTFDTTTLDPDAKGFAGAAFDGRYVYFAPSNDNSLTGHVVARFDAKTPPSIPRTYSGSFL
jgi:hypothetical protein